MDGPKLTQTGLLLLDIEAVPIFLSEMAAQFTSLGIKLSPHFRLFLWATFPEVELLDQKVRAF